MIETVKRTRNELESLKLDILRYFSGDGNYSLGMHKLPQFREYTAYEVKLMRQSLVNTNMIYLMNDKRGSGATYALLPAGKEYLELHDD